MTDARAALVERIKTLELALSVAIEGIEEWCKAIAEKGTSWDDWDEHYKNFAYRGGLETLKKALKPMPIPDATGEG